MTITIRPSVSREGYITLAAAAEQIGLSTARARYYVGTGKLESIRDGRNRIHVKEESIDAFLADPPQRGGRKTGTGTRKAYSYTPASVSHVKGAIRQVNQHVEDSTEKETCLAVLRELLDYAIEVWMAEKSGAEETVIFD